MDTVQRRKEIGNVILETIMKVLIQVVMINMLKIIRQMVEG